MRVTVVVVDYLHTLVCLVLRASLAAS